MTHQLVRIIKEMPPDVLHKESEVLTACQNKCNLRLSRTVQLEQEAYLTNHPEVIAALKLGMAHVIGAGCRKDVLAQMVAYFTEPAEIIEKKVREFLKAPRRGTFFPKGIAGINYVDYDLDYDLANIFKEFHPDKPIEMPTPPRPESNTTSSTFLSIVSSGTTPATPEPEPVPELTMEQLIFKMVEATLDKATLSKVTDALILYDAAYVRLMEIVEDAMEVPVIEIRQDIADLYAAAYHEFDLIIDEVERLAAERLWEKRMRKKYKRTLRRQENFKGYVTPPSTKSTVSSHESYKVPPPRPCVCHPQTTYNRYAKDRFGIYLPREEEFNKNTITITPIMSSTDLADDNDPKPE